MRITLAVVIGIAALLMPGTAVAAPPANDNFANANTISSLPFSDTASNVEATFEGGEIGYCGVSNTVWYQYTPSSDQVLRLSPSGSSIFGVVLNAYRQTGSGLAGLSHVTCSTFSTDLTLSVQSGTTYYIQAGGSYYGSGNVRLAVSIIPPPPNDGFANAEVIGSLNFSDVTDTSAGTTESDEPNPSCNLTGQRPAGSIWYRYTPSADGWVSASTFGSNLSTALAAYTGNSLGALAQKACRTQYGRMTLAVQAGQTYSFFVGGLYGARGNIAFQLEVAPDPVPNFGRNIGDPSIYDTVQFYNFAYDPGDVGIASYEWDFGDGTTSTEGGPSHRYATDGSYSVRFTVRTHDGRSATSEQLVSVATHDVAITKLSVPQSASTGQTRSIVVGVQNRRYAETVRVDVYRSTASGFVYFASSTQSVPIRGGNRATDFTFNYTFTSEDAALGKVTFKAIASIVDKRDALPTDNEAISLQTKVNK